MRAKWRVTALSPRIPSESSHDHDLRSHSYYDQYLWRTAPRDRVGVLDLCQPIARGVPCGRKGPIFIALVRI
jgi:hypothetical protein